MYNMIMYTAVCYIGNLSREYILRVLIARRKVLLFL